MTPGEVADVRGRSNASVEDAIKRGIASVDKTIENVRCLWMRERRVEVGPGAAPEYHVDMWITFIGDDWGPGA
jgi:flavin-binding protein dodecin